MESWEVYSNYLKITSPVEQRVGLNGSFSNYSLTKSGIPQGSVLGPLLLLVYINDLEKNIKSNVKFFADDTMLYSVDSDSLISAADHNHDLELISLWAFQWKWVLTLILTKKPLK